MTQSILILTFLASSLIFVGILRSMERPLKTIFPHFQDRLRFHGPMSALLIALGLYGDTEEEESGDDGDLGISSKAYSLLGLSERQYNRGIVRMGGLFVVLGILFFLAFTSYGMIATGRLRMRLRIIPPSSGTTRFPASWRF